MNNFLYERLRKLFKSDWHAQEFVRLLGNRAFYPGGIKKIIEMEKMEALINDKLEDKEIAEKLGICQRKVFNFRKMLWNV